MTSDPNALPPLPEQPNSPETNEDGTPRRRILVGSQRDPAAYRPKPKRDWEPSTPPEAATPAASSEPAPETPAPAVPAVPEAPVAPAAPAVPVASVESPAAAVEGGASASDVGSAAASPESAPQEGEGEGDGRGRRRRGDRQRGKPSARAALSYEAPVVKHVAVPNLRSKLSPELEAELAEALGEDSLDALMVGGEAVSKQIALEPESKHAARVIAVRREDVFVELGGREQGLIPLRQFAEKMPEIGDSLEVVVTRFNRDDGLYELALPNAAASVGDWSHISEGITVEARITGHNAGGLECEVGNIRGFIPISQIALYRVENLAEFVEQKFICVVTEANPMRKNLVLSRRAVLEREKEENRRKMFESLAPGQLHEGIVRKLMDFGAFVDLGGGVDGLIHISQLGWGRIRHPRDVVSEGQRVSVRIEKFDPATGKISLGYRDLMASPWNDAQAKYQPNMPVHGRVVKIMEFGAFVELEPGVEGLIHISELSHKRVARVGDVVHEGDEVDVMVLSVDSNSQRISLSLKNMQAPPEQDAPAAAAAPVVPEPAPASRPKPASGPLKGGLGKKSGGESFGLKW